MIHNEETMPDVGWVPPLCFGEPEEEDNNNGDSNKEIEQ